MRQMGLHLPDHPASRDGLNEVLKGLDGPPIPADVTTYANSESFPQIMHYMVEGPR